MGLATASGQSPNPAPTPLRALVTRPHAASAGLAEALEARGIEAIVEPLFEIHYRAAPPPDLAGVQAILCTSGNGVRALARLSDERRLPLFAVGDATAAQARAAGFAAVENAGGAVGDLVRLVCRLLCPAAGHLLHVAGSAVAGDLAGELREAGFTVERAVLYEARPAAAFSAASAAALAAGSLDFVLFFSPRTAATFVRLAAQAGLAAATGCLTAVSISAAADAALADLRFRERHIALRPDQPGLLASLDRLIAERRPG
ncbi:MAG TPA: uroporphyrinogen-III synthase [Stellaceae bacterium]|nr:uroporphyrinogen-III synthase [Stellaceae bacterium]